MNTPQSMAQPSPVSSGSLARSGPVPVSDLPTAAHIQPVVFETPPVRARAGRVTFRAVRRYWLWILVLWVLGSAGLIALIQLRVRPVYEATAWLKVDVMGGGRVQAPTTGDLDILLRTQGELLTSPAVLAQALADPEIKELAWLRRAADPQASLAAVLQVMVRPRTSLLLVSTASADRHEAARVVNAVVRAYQAAAASWTDPGLSKQIAHLDALRGRYRAEIERYQQELESLIARTGGVDRGATPGLETTRYRQYHARLGAIELERLEAEASLDALRQAADRRDDRPPPSPPIGADLDRRIEQAFRTDPEVTALHAELRQAQATLRTAERQPPAARTEELPRIRQRIERLQADNERLWDAKQTALRARVIAEANSSVAQDAATADRRAVETRLSRLRVEEQRLREELQTIRAQSQAEGSESLRAQFLVGELNATTELDHRVAQMLDQLQAESRSPIRVSQISAAQPARLPRRDSRNLVFATVSAGLIIVLVGLFTLVEVRAARVVDPDELAARLRLGVLGIVPPLPLARPGSSIGPASQSNRRQVEEFVQSLDHLRVALDAVARTGGRCCVMITSAMPGEGKTTLAAQLAARCAHAGLTTLLIDADLRRPALGRLLEIPEGPGLADVLLGEATPEEALMVIGNAGGFHLLPAGGGEVDPIRLLQGDRLGQLLARARATFQMVLIDVPPVLPVADALLIGRWTDGAVLAVRHDVSRFPLVERARRRLTSTGISVVGAVLNGCRPDASSYGGYGYYGRPRDADLDWDPDQTGTA